MEAINRLQLPIKEEAGIINNFTYIDLFSGCGGLSLGLCNAGWRGLFAIEKSPDAFETLKHNLIDKGDHFDWVDWLPKRSYDIRYVIQKHKKNLQLLQGGVDLVAGGPPCQGFSTAGRRIESDQRNQLVKSYIRFIKLVNPKIIFFENVKGFTLEFKKNQEKGTLYSSYVIAKLENAGYHVHGKLVNFGDYGIPQNRTRFILVGIRRDLPGASVAKAEEFFVRLKDNRLNFLTSKGLPLNPTLEDAIADLLKKSGTQTSPDTAGFQSGTYSAVTSAFQTHMRGGRDQGIADSHRFANHRPHIVERFEDILKHAPKDKDLSNELKVKYEITKHSLIPLDEKKPCRTLTTNTDDLIHYCEPRTLTVREYARIQGFPDSFEIKGKYTTGGLRRRIDVPRYTQIGNSISPLFSEQSGLILKSFLQHGTCS